MELWTSRVGTAVGFGEVARRAEEAGWDGIAVTDSQNLCPDPFVALALGAAATERLKLATGVTNAYTRHPAALAAVAATVQEASAGRMVLGIGRGDTALFHLGRKPMPLRDFFARVTDLQTYLGQGTVDCDGFESRIRWLRTATQPKVPLDVAVSGPKMIAFAARLAERVTFAVGADPERMAWALELARKEAAAAGRNEDGVSFGAFLNVGCHPDAAVGAELIRGGVAAFAHFSAMPGSKGDGLRAADRSVVAEVGRRYDSRRHLRNDADHTGPLHADFVDRFAVVGPPDRCVGRIRELAALGIERFVLIGPGFAADVDDARTSTRLLAEEVLPALR
jgi:5,10-methylenetetrahydromethanopterin reductase